MSAPEVGATRSPALRAPAVRRERPAERWRLAAAAAAAVAAVAGCGCGCGCSG